MTLALHCCDFGAALRALLRHVEHGSCGEGTNICPHGENACCCVHLDLGQQASSSGSHRQRGWVGLPVVLAQGQPLLVTLHATATLLLPPVSQRRATKTRMATSTRRGA